MDNPVPAASAADGLVADAHLSADLRTPLRSDAFHMPDEAKIDAIAGHFRQIMDLLGLDLNDDSLNGTPRRVAKMYVQEWFRGLNPEHRPDVKLFDNRYSYQQMLVERDITLFSCCEHHFVPIIGKAHVAYLPGEHVVGLSKLNRVVQYYARRPQVQERLTRQIAEELKNALRTEDVAVLIEADHLCVMSRGVNDTSSGTLTAEYGGAFASDQTLRSEFLRLIGK
ncbi:MULTISPECIES: GTP cyclohydrolase I FolE [Hymenobacter]|uniref:GTP cyclohydrolase 1 n=1 Tax=Hymenobacter jejuensis TaxID=2502781 RepID=A0A5B8A4A0_9BACT|nr:MULTISPECIES: GTP cyclohydrolase I FolE [Hymenobacter]MBC6990625.1 GTP cyclohydrolase I FolE [Hymenobacter sp. BT491]QDA60962.1 GTP cyclohydrolase I FolE [Hymenobacter jejuensis]